jgi:hypothetical protein
MSNIKRKVGKFTVYQRTKDDYFEISDLAKQRNKLSPKSSPIYASDFFEDPSIGEFLEEVAIEKALTTSHLIEEGYGEVWIHPLVLIRYVMWLDPAFEVQEITRLITSRGINYIWEIKDSSRLVNAFDKL